VTRDSPSIKRFPAAGRWRGLIALACLALPLGASAAAQLPPIGIRIDPPAGWEDVTTVGEGAALILRRRGGSGRAEASFNVVISESGPVASGALTDPGVAEGLERQVLGALAGARVVDRGFVTVGEFKAYRLTVELSVDGKPKVLRQTTVDVRRGAVTATAIMDAAESGALLDEVDRMVASMTIDVVQ
jgi:hypothetical protein